MKKFWKALALVGCALLLVVASVAGTYAILTSKTATVSNTFTAGNVSINMTETKVDAYGEALTGENAGKWDTDNDETPGNEYKLIPNHTYQKDPTIHVKAGSEECYLFVKVVNGISEIEAGTTIATQLATNGWSPLEVDNAPVANVWVYNQKVDARTAAKDVTVFTTFTIANVSNFSEYVGVNPAKDPTIYITAYAAQADGFGSADLAWKAAGTAFN